MSDRYFKSYYVMSKCQSESLLLQPKTCHLWEPNTTLNIFPYPPINTNSAAYDRLVHCQLSSNHTEGLFCLTAESPKTEISIKMYSTVICAVYIIYVNERLQPRSSFDFAPFIFVATGGVTLLWPWVLSSYATVQRLQPLELFHGFNFLFPWLNLRLYLWRQLVYPPCT